MVTGPQSHVQSGPYVQHGALTAYIRTILVVDGYGFSREPLVKYKHGIDMARPKYFPLLFINPKMEHKEVKKAAEGDEHNVILTYTICEGPKLDA